MLWETVLSSLVRFVCKAKCEQFAKAQTTENHMMATTNALTAVQENAGSSGCGLVHSKSSHVMSSFSHFSTNAA